MAIRHSLQGPSTEAAREIDCIQRNAQKAKYVTGEVVRTIPGSAPGRQTARNRADEAEGVSAAFNVFNTK